MGQVIEDGDLGVELVGPRALPPLPARHPQTGQFVAFKTCLPVVGSLHQLFGHQLAREDQILQPRSLALFLSANQGIRIVARKRSSHNQSLNPSTPPLKNPSASQGKLHTVPAPCYQVGMDHFSYGRHHDVHVDHLRQIEVNLAISKRE